MSQNVLRAKIIRLRRCCNKAKLFDHKRTDRRAFVFISKNIGTDKATVIDYLVELCYNKCV